MTVQLDWPSEVVDRLTEEARQKGLSLDDHVLQTVLKQKTANGPAPYNDDAKRQAREEAGRSIRDLRKGNILWTRSLHPRPDRKRAPVLSPFVLDNSVSAAWFFEDQSTPYTDAVLQAVIDGASALVPAIWRLEVVNSLVVAERRKRAAPAKVAKFLQDLQWFNITARTTLGGLLTSECAYSHQK